MSAAATTTLRHQLSNAFLVSMPNDTVLVHDLAQAGCRTQPSDGAPAIGVRAPELVEAADECDFHDRVDYRADCGLVSAPCCRRLLLEW